MLLVIQLTILPIEFKETVIENIFLPRVNITKYKVLSDGRNFYDQPINDQIKKYENKKRNRKQEKEIVIQQDVYYIINTSKTITN